MSAIFCQRYITKNYFLKKLLLKKKLQQADEKLIQEKPGKGGERKWGGGMFADFRQLQP